MSRTYLRIGTFTFTLHCTEIIKFRIYYASLTNTYSADKCFFLIKAVPLSPHCDRFLH